MGQIQWSTYEWQIKLIVFETTVCRTAGRLRAAGSRRTADQLVTLFVSWLGDIHCQPEIEQHSKKQIRFAKNCMLVFKDAEKYLKDKTPPVIDGTAKLPVELSVDVKEIIAIDEVEQVINIQFKLSLSWFDGRLQYLLKLIPKVIVQLSCILYF